jgi:hypothetical protein
MPDEEDRAHVKELEAKYPTAMPYFFTQDPDYITVKERVAKHTVDGKEAEVCTETRLAPLLAILLSIFVAHNLSFDIFFNNLDLSMKGIATLQIAIETLRVAEYLTPILQEQLK